MPMKNPPHPGLSIRHDCLEPLGLSVTDAAAHLGVSRKQLSDVINGHAGISPEMAVRLDKAFGGGAAAWYQLQAAYDLAQVMQRADEIDVSRRIIDHALPRLQQCDITRGEHGVYRSFLAGPHLERGSALVDEHGHAAERGCARAASAG